LWLDNDNDELLINLATVGIFLCATVALIPARLLDRAAAARMRNP